MGHSKPDIPQGTQQAPTQKNGNNLEMGQRNTLKEKISTRQMWVYRGEKYQGD